MRSLDIVKKLLIRQGIDLLILNLDRHSHFVCSTKIYSLIVKISSTIDPGSRKRLIEVGHGIGKWYVPDLSKGTNWSADGLARLPVKIWILLRTFS